MELFERGKQIKQEMEEKKRFSAEEVYERAKMAKRRMAVATIAFIVMIEVTVSSGLAYEIYQNDFHNRVLREFEIRTSGEIRLSTGTYTGETDFGYFFGEGNFDFDSGASYTGSWSDNFLSGYGELRVPINGIYYGDFSFSQKSGNGVFSWDDGSIYEGEWNADQMVGQGVYTGADGVIYTGTFKNNALYKGNCTFENETGTYCLAYKEGRVCNAVINFIDGSEYSGGADENTLNGDGQMTFANQDVYNGGFLNGTREGYGTYTWAFGDRYDGEWSDDKMSGTGIYTFDDGSILDGVFSNNSFIDGSYHVINDFGDYTFTISGGKPTEVDMKLANGTKCIGEINGERLNGQARIEYSNGDKYDGKVANGMKSGQGIYIWVSGASYDGAWSDDQMSGCGTYTYPANENGYKLVGTFKGGLPDGECEYYVSASVHYQTTWLGGKCIKVTE